MTVVMLVKHVCEKSMLVKNFMYVCEAQGGQNVSCMLVQYENFSPSRRNFFTKYHLNICPHHFHICEIVNEPDLTETITQVFRQHNFFINILHQN